MKNNLSIIMSILILIVLAAGVYFIVQTVREGAAAATEPFNQVNQANQSLQTQIAEVMHPTPTIIPDPVTYINEIRALARLETIEYNMQQVVEVDDKQGTFGFLYGTQYLVVVHGTVVAGIDMSKIQPGDLRLEGNILYVTLPPAEVLTTTVDESKVKVYTPQKGIWADPNPNLVVEALQVGKDQILNVALEDGILVQAQTNAEAYLTKFFSSFGYQTVVLDD
jgi:hypothetical protein